MDNSGNKTRIGDRSSSDVVVRLRTQTGRDEWFYCHSQILTEKSKYFSDRLSDNWPTCQILDSRNCVEVSCLDSDFDYHVHLLRLLYDFIEGSIDANWSGVQNALGILQVAVFLGCPDIITPCVNYLEAVPWEEAEEEEILKIVPGLGSSQVDPILARLQPVRPSAIVAIFLSTVQFATSSPPLHMSDIKSSAQEQLEYMLTEDDDAPLLAADNEIKLQVNASIKRLLGRFSNLVEELLCEPIEESGSDHSGKIQILQSCLSDMSWACQILNKLEIMKDFVSYWVDISDKIVKVVEPAASSNESETINIRLKIVEVTAKVVEAVGYGAVIIPTSKRIHLVNIWLPFVQISKPIIDSVTSNSEDEEEMTIKVDGELWQSLESTFVSMILALPSEEQADILIGWLQNEHVSYPDLTEAFEVWCYRTKVAKRRLSLIGRHHSMDATL